MLAHGVTSSNPRIASLLSKMEPTISLSSSTSHKLAGSATRLDAKDASLDDKHLLVEMDARRGGLSPLRSVAQRGRGQGELSPQAQLAGTVSLFDNELVWM